MKQAGFAGVFVNIGDHQPEEWATIRSRAANQAMFCGPWLRTQNGSGRFSLERLETLINCADMWQQPLIVNSESELKGSGDTLTSLIKERVGSRQAALSMEAMPFADVHWYPLADIPVLPQVFSDLGINDPYPVRSLWWGYGVNCVYPTYGTYGTSRPGDYPLQAPYSLYSADDCHGDYAAWAPRAGSWEGCKEIPPPEDEMTPIGPNHGITATMNRLRNLDPGGTLLVKNADGKWPPVDTLSDPNRPGGAVPLVDWKAYDKAERTLMILVTDHDAEIA